MQSPQKKHIITIAGRPGSGKSTTSKTIAEELGYEHFSGDPAAYAVRLQQRLDSEAMRYKKLYDINPYDKSNYDFVINTGTNTLDEVVAQVLDAYHRWAA